MLSDALALAILSTIGFVMTFSKLPRKVRRFLQKYALFTDIVTVVLTYITLGGTLTALTAGAMVGIFTSMLMYVANNPDDFIYLYDIRDLMRTKLAEMKVTLNELGKEYKEKKLREAKVIDV